jgi:hypothetical protein
MFRKELAALWVTLKGDGQQEQAIRQMHKEMETVGTTHIASCQVYQLRCKA